MGSSASRAAKRSFAEPGSQAGAWEPEDVFSSDPLSAVLPDTGRLRLSTGRTPAPRAVEFSGTAEPQEHYLRAPEQGPLNHCTPAIYVLQLSPSGGNAIGQRRAA